MDELTLLRSARNDVSERDPQGRGTLAALPSARTSRPPFGNPRPLR